MAQQIVLTPIGTVRSAIEQPADDVWGGLRSRIELDSSRFSPECLAGLASFSHVELVFYFHLADESKIIWGAEHPRDRLDWPKVGIFALRRKDRPNRIGVTTCRLLSVGDLSIEVADLDAIDGTPVLDIKPYVREFGPRGEAYQPSWCTEIMAGYWGSSG